MKTGDGVAGVEAPRPVGNHTRGVEANETGKQVARRTSSARKERRVTGSDAFDRMETSTRSSRRSDARSE